MTLKHYIECYEISSEQICSLYLLNIFTKSLSHDILHIVLSKLKQLEFSFDKNFKWKFVKSILYDENWFEEEDTQVEQIYIIPFNNLDFEKLMNELLLIR